MQKKINKQIEELFKGGYPSPLLNGLKTANCGKHIKFNNCFYEVMSHDISGHPTNIISKYLIQTSFKIEFSCWINKNNSEYIFGIAYYKNKMDTASYRYTNKIPKKYEYLKEELKKVHFEIFNGVRGRD